MGMPQALRRVFAAALFGLVGLGVGCAAKIPIEAAPTGGPERLVIDIREPKAYAAGHTPGSLNIQLGWDQLEVLGKCEYPGRELPWLFYYLRRKGVKGNVTVSGFGPELRLKIYENGKGNTQFVVKTTHFGLSDLSTIVVF